MFRINDVDYHTQINNKFWNFTACYSTSISTAMDYCLSTINKTKESVGCPSDWQLDDFIAQVTENDTTKQWIRNNVTRLGSWILNVTPRYNAFVEEFVFNALMNQFGFKSVFESKLSYEKVCEYIEKDKLPMPIHGWFPFLQGGGHITVVVGFNESNGSFILHDPFGDARKKYAVHDDGSYVEYKASDYYKYNKDCMMIQHIQRI